eukprot:4270437-Pleurochrysis_carterae.AAC.2
MCIAAQKVRRARAAHIQTLPYATIVRACQHRSCPRGESDLMSQRASTAWIHKGHCSIEVQRARCSILTKQHMRPTVASRHMRKWLLMRSILKQNYACMRGESDLMSRRASAAWVHNVHCSIEVQRARFSI